MEGISGATASFDRYRRRKERLIVQKKKDRQRKYFDGIFQGQSRANNHGYSIALVEIKDDRIIRVKLKKWMKRG